MREFEKCDGTATDRYMNEDRNFSAETSENSVSVLRSSDHGFQTVNSERPPLPLPLPIPPLPLPIPGPGDCRFGDCYPRLPQEPPPVIICDDNPQALRSAGACRMGEWLSNSCEPPLTISEERVIKYPDGSQSRITLGESGRQKQVDEFVSADGVKYKRQELGAQEREILKAKLGHEPDASYSVWTVEGGGIGKSNGASDRKIIASVNFNPGDNNVTVKTAWPVPQETDYFADGSFTHSFVHGAKTVHGSLPDGRSTLVQDWPNSNFERVIVNDKNGEQKILDWDKKTGSLTDVTLKYRL